MPLRVQSYFLSVVETFVLSYLERHSRSRRMSFNRFNTVQGHHTILLSREQLRQMSNVVHPLPIIPRQPRWAALTQQYTLTYPDDCVTIITYADASLRNPETQRVPILLLPNTQMGLRMRPIRYIQDRSYQGNGSYRGDLFALAIRVATSFHIRPTFDNTKARHCPIGIPIVLRSQ